VTDLEGAAAGSKSAMVGGGGAVIPTGRAVDLSMANFAMSAYVTF